ncbi:MAG: fluoride efflux transporter CrcB [Nitrospirota bacterium]
MKQFILVGIGGGIGAMARYKIGSIFLHHVAHWKFPLGTFVINVLGCLIAGILASLFDRHVFFNADMRLFLFTGLLGGFTTFSAFGLETVYLIEQHEPFIAMMNIMMSVLVGCFALWLGMKIVP